MKKILVYLAMIVMAFAFSACGEKENDYDEEKRETVETKEKSELEQSSGEEVEDTEIDNPTSSSEIIENTELESRPIEEENDNQVLFPVYEPYNSGTYLIQDDWLYVLANVDEEGNKKWFAYDAKVKKVVNEEGLNDIRDCLDIKERMSGKSLISGGTGDSDYLWYFGAKLIDVANGDVLAALNENQTFVGSWIEGRILVLEVVETFEGNTYAMGVMTETGEWLYPLSTDYPWLDSSMSRDQVGTMFAYYRYLGDGIYEIGDYYFDMKNNHILQRLDYDKYAIPIDEGKIKGKYADNGWLCCAKLEDESMVSFNIATGEFVELCEGYETAWNAGYDVGYQVYGNGLFIRTQDNNVQVKNFAGDIIAEYDMTPYKGWNIEGLTEERRFIICNNGSGTKYACLINSNGSMEFEPQKLEDIVSGRDFDVHLDDNKLMLVNNGHRIFIYNIASKEMITKDIPYTIRGYLDESNTLFVEAEHPEYGKGYYLADINDLDTLVNPFEMNSATEKEQLESTEKLSDLDLIKQVISQYSDGEVFSHVVIKQMPDGIEAFALTEEIFGMDDEGYADIIQSNENYGDEIHRMAGWYINGKKAKQVFLSSDEIEGEGKGYIPTWLNQEEIGVGLCPLLKDGTQLIQVEWSISGHNSGSVFYEIGNNDAIYAFSGSDMMSITEDGRILSCYYYYHSVEEREVWEYIEYTYENGELKMINSWTEYSEM